MHLIPQKHSASVPADRFGEPSKRWNVADGTKALCWGLGVRDRLLATVAVVGVLALGHVWGGETREGATIAAVEFKGLERITRAEALGAIGSREGTAYRAQTLSEDIKRLDALGCFYYVSAGVDETPEGLKVIFEVLEKPYLAYVELRGVKSFKKSQLLKEAGLVEDDFLDPYAADTAAESIASFYRAKGYMSADVSMTRKVGDKGVVLTFNVFEGPRTRIKAINFKGNKAFLGLVLLSKMTTRPHFFIISPGIFDEEAFERDLETLEQSYHAAGYLDATVTADKEFDEKRKWLTITVFVEEGPLWHVRNINLVGNEAIPGREIRALMKLNSGDPYRKEDIAAEVRRIEFHYGDKGYIEARVVEVKPTYSLEGQLVDIDFVIREGIPYRVGRVEIRGNIKTKDKVIRRAIDLFPGELYTRTAMEDGRHRLIGSGLFKRVDFLHQPSEVEGVQDLVIQVEEGPTASLRFGAGVSSNQGLIGNVAFHQANFDLFDLPTSFADFFTGNSFVGAGQTLEIAAEPGTTYSRYLVKFREPYLLDQPVSFSTTLFAFDSQRYDYDETKMGVQFSIGRRFRRALYVESGLRLESIDISDVEETAPSPVLDVAGSSALRAVHLTVGYDKLRRMHHRIPFSGYEVSGMLENAGTILGGDFDFNRFVATAEAHQTIYEKRDDRHVLSIITRAGVVDEAGDSDDVPIFERFFAGGFRSIRGFAYRHVGPHEMGDPIGGKLLTTMNVEYNLPLFTPGVRGVFFWDVGSVFAEPEQFSFDELRTSVGFGVRLYSDALGPIPVSLDLGIPLNAKEEDETSLLSFSMGTVF